VAGRRGVTDAWRTGVAWQARGEQAPNACVLQMNSSMRAGRLAVEVHSLLEK